MLIFNVFGLKMTIHVPKMEGFFGGALYGPDVMESEDDSYAISSYRQGPVFDD